MGISRTLTHHDRGEGNCVRLHGLRKERAQSGEARALIQDLPQKSSFPLWEGACLCAAPALPNAGKVTYNNSPTEKLIPFSPRGERLTNGGAS